MASRGLVTMMSTASGERCTTSRVTEPTMFRLVSRRSSRLMPGLRATPEVMTTMSEPSVSS